MNLNTGVLVISWYIYNGVMSKAMVTLNLIVVNMRDNSMVHVLQARVLKIP